MREKPLKKNSRFYLGMVLNVVEGMLSGIYFFIKLSTFAIKC